MDTDEYIDLALIADNGVLISDTFETWRQKTNGIIVETAALGERVDELSNELFPGSVPNFVTLLTAQNINGVKTFGAGSASAPFLKVGAAGFYYDTTGGINALTSTTTLRSVKLINSGSMMSLRGIDYTLPFVGPSGSKYSFMIANTAGNQMGWMTASDMIIGSSLATDSLGRLYVNQITSTELAPGAVGTLHIVDGRVTSEKLATGSVTTAKIADKQVTAAKIADATITAFQMAANSIGTPQIVNSGVTTAKIADNSVTTAKIVDNSIIGVKIADGAISATNLNGSQIGIAPVYGARAWVLFNGNVYSTVGLESRCQIVGSGNVSKVVRLGLGNYDVYYTIPLNNAIYAATASASGWAGNEGVLSCGPLDVTRPRTASRISIGCSRATDGTSSGDLVDASGISVVIFG